MYGGAGQQSVASGHDAAFGALCRAVGAALGLSPAAGVSVAAIDAARLEVLAVRHRCLPLLVEGLERDGPAAVPPNLRRGADAFTRLVRRRAGGVTRSAFLAHRLVDILDGLRQASLRAMAFKGPALSQVLYGHPDWRPSDDLDVWVHPDDFASACRWLEEQGYRPLVSLSPQEARAHCRAGWDRAYRSVAGDCVVELCTAMTPRYFARPPDPDELWRDSSEVLMEAGRVRVPRLEALAELLCLHGAKHGWSRLLWVADIAALCGVPGHVDHALVRTASRSHGTDRMVDLGLRLAHAYLGADIGFCRAWPALERHVAGMVMGTGRWRNRNEEVRFHLSCWRRMRDRIRYVLLYGLTPGVSDWRAVRLAPWAFCLHWLLRPVRLLGRGRHASESRMEEPSCGGKAH